MTSLLLNNHKNRFRDSFLPTVRSDFNDLDMNDLWDSWLKGFGTYKPSNQSISQFMKSNVPYEIEEEKDRLIISLCIPFYDKYYKKDDMKLEFENGTLCFDIESESDNTGNERVSVNNLHKKLSFRYVVSNSEYEIDESGIVARLEKNGTMIIELPKRMRSKQIKIE